MCVIASPAYSSRESDQEFFETKVRPLLAKNCYTCHTDARAGGLQMDSEDGMKRGSKDGPVLVPGKPDESKLIQAIRYKDRVKMPPSRKLTDEEISTLETWVRSGAVWGHAAARSKAASTPFVITPEARAFWSFRPVRAPAPPSVKNRSWIKSPIDSFVLAKLETAGLKPVDAADKRTLIRRATIDLLDFLPHRRKSKPSRKILRPKPLQKWSTGCWRRRNTVSGGAGCGLTWPDTRTSS